MAGPPVREQALLLLASANNHGDLAVKLSSLKQVKDILMRVEPFQAAELFPYLVELQFSPESLVRKYLIEVIDEIGEKSLEHTSLLLPVLLTFLKDNNPVVAKQSVITGTKYFCSVLKELAIKFQRHGIVERWLEGLWTWMIKFKDAVLDIIFEAGPVGLKLLAIKFLEKYILHFSSDSNDSETYTPEVSISQGKVFNVSWIMNGHPILNPPALISEANRNMSILLDMLRSSSNFPGSLTISLVNSVAAIARKRPVFYKSVLNSLLEFNLNFETVKGRHSISIRYSLRTAFLGFLRCTHPIIQESREKLLKSLRAMNAGDAADQVIRQIDKIMKNNERASRDLRLNKDDQLSSQSNKRSAPIENDDQNDNKFDVTSKRPRVDPTTANPDVNGGVSSPVLPALDRDLTPVEQMIAMISALIAEGERGFGSLEILISNIHPDLLADIVLTNMKNLPNNSPPFTKYGDFVPNRSNESSTESPQLVALNGSDPPTTANQSAESKRDPRRDPRRIDPRRGVAAPVDATQSYIMEETANFHASAPPSTSENINISTPLTHKIENNLNSSKNQEISEPDLSIENDEIPESESNEFVTNTQLNNEEDTSVQESIDLAILDEAYGPSQDTEHFSPGFSNLEASEIESVDLPVVIPPYIELAEESRKNVRKIALERIMSLYRNLERPDFKQTQMELVARLFAQTDVDDVVGLVQNFIVSDYEQQKGLELVMHILYHLHSLVVSDSDSFATAIYDKFLMGVAKSMLDDLPASDKSFSRLLGEVPFIPGSLLRLLENVCTETHSGADGDRVMQGLGAVWSLILGRPPNRQACLDIALKCAVHSKEDIRAKAIRLVANKLYSISYISEKIEKYATDVFLSAVNEPDKSVVEQVDIQDTSISGSEPGVSQNTPDEISFSQAQSHLSLLFALCTKKPSLLQLVFCNYVRAPKPVKQAVHRLIPILIRNLGSSSSELLHIISNPPEGSEHLLTQVLHVLTEGTTPSQELVETVKYLYETRLKDATIIIPILSAFSRDEVLPIFPRLVDLPMDTFQTALAHILQGSAHTGPALTPVEVLVAIHDILPERDGLPLKKITDACSACFEQRTVFTQQVLLNALNQMVDRTPIPLLFMRTVIQAIDAFPTLVNFVMEILSKLVQRQVWRMPKLWVGFLKCISQMQPHSFRVLLQLPSPQLESALNKYANLRGPLATFVSQSSSKNSIPRSTLLLLGLTPEASSHMQQQSHNTNASDHPTSVRGATIT